MRYLPPSSPLLLFSSLLAPRGVLFSLRGSRPLWSVARPGGGPLGWGVPHTHPAPREHQDDSGGWGSGVVLAVGDLVAVILGQKHLFCMDLPGQGFLWLVSPLARRWGHFGGDVLLESPRLAGSCLGSGQKEKGKEKEKEMLLLGVFFLFLFLFFFCFCF